MDDLFIEPSPQVPLTLQWGEPSDIFHPDFPRTDWYTADKAYRVSRVVSNFFGEHWAEHDGFYGYYARTTSTAPYDDHGNRLLNNLGKPLKHGPDKTVWTPVAYDKGGTNRRFKTLELALEACEKRAALSSSEVQSNAELVLAAASSKGLDVIPVRKPLVPPVPKLEKVRVEAVAVIGMDELNELGAPVGNVADTSVVDDLFSEV